MHWFRKVITRWHKESTTPSGPAPSMYTAAHRQQSEDRHRDNEMQHAIEKERSRRGLGF